MVHFNREKEFGCETTHPTESNRGVEGGKGD